MPDHARRAHDRVDFETEVTIVAGDRTIVGSCKNISQGGIFVATAEPLPMEGAVRLRFTLPDLKGDFIDTEAHVRWVEREGSTQNGVGLQFVGLRPLEVWAVNQLFRRRPKDT